MKFKDVASRFNSRTRPDGDCVIWTGTTLQAGYGCMSVLGKPELAHRISYRLNIGQIPSGMHVLHSCDVRACVNPAHLWLGTNSDNIADRARKGRSNLDRSKQSGEQSNLAKITAADVIAIRSMRDSGMTLHAIAERFPIKFGAVHAIVTKRNWKHV